MGSHLEVKILLLEEQILSLQIWPLLKERQKRENCRMASSESKAFTLILFFYEYYNYFGSGLLNTLSALKNAPFRKIHTPWHLTRLILYMYIPLGALICTPPSFPASFTKGSIFCDFLSASLGYETLLKVLLLLLLLLLTYIKICTQPFIIILSLSWYDWNTVETYVKSEVIYPSAILYMYVNW